MFQNVLNRHWPYVYFTSDVFCFHVSFLCFNLLIINAFKGWNIRLLCFIFSFNVSFWKHWGRKTKTLWERFKNTEGAISKHCGSVKALPQCFEEWNMKLKMKHKSRMFHFLKCLIFNKLKQKNETWKINQRLWKRIEMCEINCNLSDFHVSLRL